MEEPIWLSKYKIIKKLGEGGSGEVFLVLHIKLNDLRAIKRISKSNPLHNQLLLEANILKNLSHPCIPCIYDLEEDMEYSYIIERYIKGQSLKEFCEVKKHLNEKLIISIGIQICNLFLYLHSLDNPILYLDLQPANIIINENNVHLVDFGTAIFRNEPDNRSASLGTKHFAPPEAYTRLKPDEKADIYGIGALLHYMVWGTSNADKRKKFVKGIENRYSKELNNIIKQCIRYQSIFRIPSVAILKKKLSKLNRIRKTGNSISNKSLNITVCGAQKRIGTTHLAILITSYLDDLGLEGYYTEENETGHMLSFLSEKVTRNINGMVRVGNCNILPKYYLLRSPDTITGLIVKDFGVLTTENKIAFLEGDIKLLLVGGKEWELEDKKRAENLLDDCNHVLYLYNFLDGCQFGKQLKGIKNENRYRIPYVPDPFYKPGNEYLDDFLWNITHINSEST